MTEQAQKGPKEDAAKQRREYLLAKCAVLIWLASVVLALIRLFWIAGQLQHAILDRLPNALSIIFVGTLWVLCTTVPLILLFFAALFVIGRRAEGINFVPPIYEQLAALPAEEILVRGSDQPIAASDELLRAAREGSIETNTDELLRAEGRAQ